MVAGKATTAAPWILFQEHWVYEDLQDSDQVLCEGHSRRD